jgi:primase-polymerase (primpol)-like protein
MSYDNIPKILTQRPQWVVWGVVGEPLKAPFQPNYLARFTTVPAKSGVPETWGTFAAAVDCVNKGLARGIGYEFAGQGIYGVDLDHVISDSGVITPEAKAIVEGLASYTEVSPSGHGLHIFVTADNANITRHRKLGGFVEIYTDARYFTVTGKVYQGFDRIAARPAELQQIHDRYLLPEPTKQQPIAYSVESAQSADDFLQRGLAKDPVLYACWNGERRRGDESASDQAFMNKLAYWCNANQTAMLAAFMQSPYFAGKDEAHQKKCRRADYLPNTAKAACATLRSTAREDTARYRQAKEIDRER